MGQLPKVVHFVTGGGSGATQVALDIACGQAAAGRYQPVLVLRAKRGRDPRRWMDAAARAGVHCHCVTGGFKLATIRDLNRILRQERPLALFAHGYSEHLWGRLAGLRSGVPCILQVEHNLERYSWARLVLSRWLARRTNSIICVSGGVRHNLERLGHPAEKLMVIYNGIDTQRFRRASLPWEQRSGDLVMVARWARQKDQLTLIRAMKRVHEAGHTDVRLHLLGGGKASHRRRGDGLIQKTGLASHVEIHGPVEDVPAFIGQRRIFVLSTRFEGFALALLEAMAAGCAVVATRAPGVDELVRDGQNGVLVPVGDDSALADAIMYLKNNDNLARAMALAGQDEVCSRFTPEAMVGAYDAELGRLAKLLQIPL